jgi:hypothetical protein
MSLSDQQRQVVEAPIDSRQLVLGGAGTGKTHALIERIRHLIDNDDVAPGSEILVLSFTRAVVRELKARLRLTEGQVRLVRPVTFDSFASRLLREVPEAEVPGGWRDAGYDGRIAIATAAIAAGGEAHAILRSYKHVFVDEIQDLVAVRADLVLEILKHVEGFTVLGDPAQAIYEYQVQDDRRATTSERFLAELRGTHTDMPLVILEEDFRANHSLSGLVTEVGTILRDPRVDDFEARPLLAEILASLDHVNTFDDLGVALKGTHESTAVLCRTNAECLRVSQLLFEADVKHHLQQEAIEQVLPTWLAQLFRGHERTKWGEVRLRKLIDERSAEGVPLPEADDVIRYLTNAVRDETVDLGVLRERLKWGQAPDPPQPAEPPLVVVSTVHRAKGLEFDRVFLGVPRNGVPERSAEEFRILYVALSRCRDDVWSFAAPNTAHWWKPQNADDRWVKPRFEPRKTLGWEFRPDDVDHMRPPGAGLASADVASLQDILSEALPVGSPVELRLIRVRAADHAVPFYAAVIGGQVVGETSEHFGEALSRRLRNGPRFPKLLSNLYLVGAETVFGSAVEGEAHGLGKSGMWLRPRIAGLAYVDWYAE